MKVSDLIQLLKVFPQDAPVAYTFESVVCVIEPDEVFMSMDGVLLIGDDYRKEFESGEMSAQQEGGLTQDAPDPATPLFHAGDYETCPHPDCVAKRNTPGR